MDLFITKEAIHAALPAEDHPPHTLYKHITNQYAPPCKPHPPAVYYPQKNKPAHRFKKGECI